MLNSKASEQLIKSQDEFFATGTTLSLAFRRTQLQKLQASLIKFEPQLLRAFHEDLRKSATESFITEISAIGTEIQHSLRHLGTWAKPEKCTTPLALAPARSEIRREPLGRCLIISPWNYPLFLNIGPLIAAISAGNVAVIKPSELAPATAHVIEMMLNETFPEYYLRVIQGDRDTSQWLLSQKWDLIFFTGGTEAGRIVAQAAAQHLTPCILELGGKSPCIVTQRANLNVCARRIVWGKFLNAGQTCVAPDYILVHQSVRQPLIDALKTEIIRAYGLHPLDNPEYPRIINQRHWQRLTALIDPQSLVFGGRSDAARLLIEPTLMVVKDSKDRMMDEEIFGPLLPIIEYQGGLDEVKTIIKSKSKPLALYLFSDDKREQETVLRDLTAGGVCINDTIVQCANPNLPFGGVGASGMGAYHGRHGFEAFSHRKAVLRNVSWIDLPIRYRPWGRFKRRALQLFLS